MKKLTLLVVMAVLCPFLSKEKGTKSKDDSINNNQRVSKYIVTLLLIIFFGFAALAQEPQTISPLKVGDKVPESFWKQPFEFYHEGKYTVATLEKYRNKLIILDFWASWCTNCLENLPKIGTFEQQLPKKAVIILVNSVGSGETKTKIENVINSPLHSISKLPCIVNDSLLTQFFPHQSIPNYTWIHMDGRFLASSSEEFLQISVVDQIVLQQALLEEERRQIQLKRKQH